jgi:hypothetical protein
LYKYKKPANWNQLFFQERTAITWPENGSYTTVARISKQMAKSRSLLPSSRCPSFTWSTIGGKKPNNNIQKQPAKERWGFQSLVAKQNMEGVFGAEKLQPPHQHTYCQVFGLSFHHIIAAQGTQNS